MKMTLEQTKLVGLTMELELKTKEYQSLCKELEELKAQKIDSNDILFVDLAQRFLDNQEEIKKIVKQLKEIRE